VQKTFRSERDAAKLLKVSIRTLQGWRVAGSGPVYAKVGKRVFYLDDDLDAFIAASRRVSTRQRADAA